jgi:hypothetical protein
VGGQTGITDTGYLEIDFAYRERLDQDLPSFDDDRHGQAIGTA